MSSTASVFHDMSGRRRRRFTWAVVAFVLLLLLAGGALAMTLLDVAPQRPLSFQSERQATASPIGSVAHRPVPSLGRAVKRAERLWRGAPNANRPLAIAFYTPWDPASAASLRRHIGELDWLVPGWMSIAGPQHAVTRFADPEGHAIIAHAARRPTLLPMVQNAVNGQWDGAGMAAILRDPKLRATALGQVEAMLVAEKADGVFFDLEDLPASAQSSYRSS